MIQPKAVYIDGSLLIANGAAVTARTTLEAARVARDAGVRLNPWSVLDRTQHIGEGPLGFYVASEINAVNKAWLS